MSPAKLFCITGVIAGSLAAEAQSFILNGDFEAPVGSPNAIAYNTTPDGWAWVGNNLGAIENGAAGILGPNTGKQYAIIGGYNEIGLFSFNLRTSFTVPATGSYLLRWADAMVDSGGTQTGPIEVQLNSQLPDYDAVFDPGQGSGPGVWHNRAVVLKLQEGQIYNLSFFPVLSGGADRGIDSVSLVSVVPEPMEYAACASIGLIGFALWRRTRRQQQA